MTQKPRNADYTKEYNRKAVLRILRRQAMSRAELARATGLTRAAASLIVEELLNAGVVTELVPQSAGRGRSATPLVLRPDSYYALAVDLARKGCTVGLCDIGGKLLQCRELPKQGDMVAAIIGVLASLLETVDKSKVLGIGISAPGPLDCESGRILNPPRFERWHGVDIGKRLSESLGLPAYLEHDVCAMALHQRNTGCSRNFMLLFIDIGIGAAIVSDGELLGNFTGELGHTTIRFDGWLCECGSRGCLETYASIPALLEKQVQSSVYMEDTLRRLGELGVTEILEVGPGKALSGFVKKTLGPDVPCTAVETAEELAAFLTKWKEARA